MAQAGRPGKVTVATNMAGRGTDIKLDAEVAARAASTSSGPSGTSRAGSTASSPADAPARATRAIASSSSRSKTRSSKPSARSPPIRIRKSYAGKGELTSAADATAGVLRPGQKERQHRRDRKLLMVYEKQRAEMRKNMGLNPYWVDPRSATHSEGRDPASSRPLAG